MKHVNTILKRYFAPFKVLATAQSGQAAMMVLKPGESTGAPDNEHPQSEQWLYVVFGSGQVTAGSKTIPVMQGSLVLIDKGETHRVSNNSRRPLVTLNFYAPPAYNEDGEPK
jgi:mannose-6-phosphate isomerase-like protein (cupin superfamily)